MTGIKTQAVAMDVIEEIKTRFVKYPQVRCTASPGSIEVHPQDESGFPVSLYISDCEFVVHFEGWHGHFDSEEEALNYFAFGLSEDCRLCTVYRGSTPTRWIVESWQNGAWVPDSEVGLLIFPFWRPRRIVYRQNHLLPVPE